MKDLSFLSDVTVVIQCYNEGRNINEWIKFIKQLGIANIVVVDDGSVDETQKKATVENVTVRKNDYCHGPVKAFFTGLYSVKTKYAFILEYAPNIDKINEKVFFDFIKFGIDGNHSLLLPEKEVKSIFYFLEPKISSILERRYNVIISEPRLDCALVGPLLLEKIKASTLGNKYVILELIRVASSENLKIGTYLLEPNLSNDERLNSKSDIFSSHYQLHNYLKVAFPKLRLQNIKDQVIVAVIIYMVLRFIEYTFSTLPNIIT